MKVTSKTNQRNFFVVTEEMRETMSVDKVT